MQRRRPGRVVGPVKRGSPVREPISTGWSSSVLGCDAASGLSIASDSTSVVVMPPVKTPTPRPYIANSLDFMRQRLRWLYGRTRGLPQRPPAPGADSAGSVMDPPWSLRIRDEAPLTIAAVVRGTAWILPDGADSRPMHAGDVALIRGPYYYTVADSPQTTPQVIIHPGQVCTTLDGVSVAEAMDQGVRTWGNAATGPPCCLPATRAPARSAGASPTRSPSWSCSAMGPGTAPAALLACRRDRQGRPRPSRRARPAARSARRRRAPRVVRSRRRAVPDLVSGSRRSDSGSRTPAPAQQPGPSLESRRPGRRSRHLPGRARATVHRTVGEPPMTFLTSYRLALAAGPAARTW